jgi:hypothetical protein
MIKQDRPKKNRIKNFHKLTLKMILFASVMDSDTVPDKPVDSCKRFMNCKSVALAKQELNNQFESCGMGKVSLFPGYKANTYLGTFLWSRNNTPSNHSPFSFMEFEPIQASEQKKNHHLTLQLILTQGQGMTAKEIKA